MNHRDPMSGPGACTVSCARHRWASWVGQLLAAGILGQTLFFKFSGAEESRHIFQVLGAEPWGRWGTGVAELVAVTFLLWPRWAAVGGLMTVGLMTGAVASHLLRLGLVVRDDGGLLFGLAVTAWLAGALVLWLRRYELPWIGPRLGGVVGAAGRG
jgi:hypothetical protein